MEILRLKTIKAVIDERGIRLTTTALADEIIIKCGTQQSVVSAWYKGTKQGTEEALKSLIEIYGHKLRRSSFRVYWCIALETNKKISPKLKGS